MKRLCLLFLSLALPLVLAGCGAATPDVNAPVGPAQAPEPSASHVPSAPAGPIAVPRVKGKTATAATWRLETAGFKVKVTWARSSQRRGRVIAQKPSSGKARPGSTIALTVAAGPGRSPAADADAAPVSAALSASDKLASSAFENRKSGIRLTGSGAVTTVLSDDNDGGRHQRFILKLSSGQTLLIAHNIDIAPRLPSLATGDTVAFNGIYEWNAEGGVVHWTHRDPSGDHAAGWLKHNGNTYQ